MATKITIVAVGDILMWRKQIASAKIPGKNQYSFGSMFQEVAPFLRNADLTIGNLETTLSGREKIYQRRNPKTTYPMFNCPDELALTLKKVGFHVLTTANNHCMDRGVNGLKRTLNVLDQNQLLHTGTFRNQKEADTPLVLNLKGIKIAIFAYTYGTNYIAVPKSTPWLVNRIYLKKMQNDIASIRSQVDLVIVSLHFGREFYRYPNEKQKKIVDFLWRNGADIILGSHPHVIQPMITKKIKRIDGIEKRVFAIYSLGNFISDRMFNNIHADSGIILKLVIHKDSSGSTSIEDIYYIPTWVHKIPTKGIPKFRVLPIKKFLQNPDRWLTKNDLDTMKMVWSNTTSHLKGKAR
ncbi:CapA family protein [Tepidibacillus fermentans]|uniref:Poly-gamma-glutamate synthesis protein (Capsule biosynthesis protein) n=1 Tax=Tepidibacillus fermentans TaxID=1281767 RepID=A0A4R3KJ47_9BACI|nr:CapA family protein [Tepidibacillus fermentans]TCS83148.1 poly-gamma-glutamate synthesis protein (capsule biosynthesis protein) [Tepidibacillus fermentans]